MFSYRVLSGAPKNHRSSQRWRTRLETGKITTSDFTFVAECIIHDRSQDGCRIRMGDDVILPPDPHLYCDKDGTAYALALAWRRGSDAGFRIIGQRHEPEEGPELRRLRALGKKFYSLER